MKKKEKALRAVIAHPIPEEQKRIAEILERDGAFTVTYITHDGLDCLREVVATQPDLVVIDAVLEKIDGLDVLRRLQEFPLAKSKKLFLTTYENYVPNYAALAGADYCVLAPYSDLVLAQRVRELVTPPRETISNREIDLFTARFFRVIGGRENVKGYYYSLDGVRFLVRDPELVLRRRVTEELYGGIARLHGVEKTERIERAMRTFTESIFCKGNLDTLSRYFTPADIQRGKITNTAFLTTVASHVSESLWLERTAGQSGNH